ncbi:MAG: hypothetical protein LUC30_10550 [Clostridiales bacterium]|nr:hypothetical protein [Clostridiales bacterium]
MEQEFHLSVGGVNIRVVSRLPLTVSDGVAHFLVPYFGNAVTITVKALEKDFDLTCAQTVGQDVHFTYYRDSESLYAVAIPGVDGSVSTAVYTPDFSEATLYINLRAFPDLRLTVDFVLQLFPLRQLLFLHQAVVLHSSRVNVGGKAIVFSAPSQTGKSTQAGLWQQYAGAEIVSNDRSILRQETDGFLTYGYPIDGSSPVFDNKRIPLGAVVMLAQGKENRVERLPVLSAVRCLTGQTVATPWDQTGNDVGQLWLNFAAVYPVYRLTCRPDREAVSCLKNRLERDGVI